MTEKKNSNILKFKGVLTSYEYAAPMQDKNGAKKHRIGIKVAPEEMKRIKAAIADAGVYKNAPDAFVPKWYKDDNAEYVNMSSKFDIRALYNDDENGVIESSIADMWSDIGILNGSCVTMACTMKDGAIYPTCIFFTKMKVVSMADLFDDDDALPFE